MRIKDISERSGVPVDTVRHYEKAGLLAPPARSANGYRHYAAGDLQRLRFIRNCRALDMSLDEVRSLLDFIDHPRGDCSPVDDLVAEHLGHVRERIAALRALERQLAALKAACGDKEPRAACGIVLALGAKDAGDSAGSAHAAGVHGRPRARRA